MSLHRALTGLGLAFAIGCGATTGEPDLNPGQMFGPQVVAFACTPRSGIAPLSSTCTMQGSHSGGTPISCSLVVMGQTLELGDCSTAKTHEFSINTPSKLSVQLVVRDTAFISATATVELEAVPRPNVAPTIDTLTGAPAEGVPPFSSTLSFTVTDADGDATSCTLDVGGDGSIEVAAFPCAQTLKVISVTALGATAVVLKATDALGAVATKTLQLTGKQPTAEIRISKVEWGQSVVTESLRLVEGKGALLRVHVLGDKGDLGKVNVDAEVRNAQGAVLGKVALTGPASPPVTEQPANLAAQWTGIVNPAWVVAGMEVRIKADATDTFVEADEANNLRTVKPTVGRGTVFALTQVPVVNGGATGNTFDAQPIMTRMWPVKSVDQKVRAPYTFSGTIAANSSAGWGTLLQSLAGARQADGSNRNYYGYVKVNYQSGVAGIGYVGMEAATGRDDSPGTLAHELGHNMGRNHAPCGGVQGADPNYPYAGAKIGSWGWDSQTGKLMSPATYYDLMAYCSPEWVSDYTYKAVQTFLEAQPHITSAPAEQHTVLVAGVVRNGKVSFRPLQRLVVAPTAVQDGAAAVRLTAADGRVATASVVLREVGDLDEQHFQAFLPDLGALASAELLSGGLVVAKARATTAGSTKPKLTRLDAATLRLQWDATHSASIAHFSDTGERTTLGLWLEGGDLRIRTDGLSGGSFEVGASDGLNSVVQTLRAD